MELAELTHLLAAPDCRLLTIIGPGGIGKTRLALEAADAVQESFADGIVFVPLQSESVADSVAPALAVAVGCTLRGQGDARGQVARFLRPMQMLLVLDNLEHLLDEASWLGELLAEAPGLRLLVTSREALNLREEWRYPLSGLGVPAEEEDDPGRSEAVRLFVERALQVQRDFSFEAERDGVVQLCRITEGMPLALELAAAWVTTLSCSAIADEIERNIAFLATDLRNVPARHRSMQAAFDHSWALLSDVERRVFQRLAVFRGGFSRQAAEQVAGAPLPLLASLVDKSLVRRGADGRFYLHELLRQYADEHLRATPDEAERVYAAHCDFYLAFVAARYDAMAGGAQSVASAEIAGELDNIRVAWLRAVAAGDIAALGRVAHPLALFYDFRARYREGLVLLEAGLRLLRDAEPAPPVDRTLGGMLLDVARLHHRLGQLSDMRAEIAESEVRYARCGQPPPPGQMTDPQVWRALLFLIDGDYPAAARLSAEVIERSTAEDQRGNLPLAWWVRAGAALWQEEVDAAVEFSRRSTEAALAVGDRWHLTYGRNMQGHVAVARGDYAEARDHYQASYVIREELDDPEGMGTALGHLGRVAALRGELDEARELYRRSLATARRIGDIVTIGNALNGLGMNACATGDHAAAGQYIAEGLHLMADSGFMRLMLTFVASAGDWLLQTGQPAAAVEPLMLAQTHPASDRDTRSRARQLLAAVQATLAPETYATAVERERSAEPAQLAGQLVPLLLAPPAAGGTPSPRAVEPEPAPVTPPPAAVAVALVEPLTARELDILRLIAVGRSNREIADQLFLSVNTVRSYSQQLYGKLSVGSRTQAVARARELGLLT
jgi:predicted ATPase/DNA-binding CsgD family transcriptional regulator